MSAKNEHEHEHEGSDALVRIAREAREDMGPRLDFDRMERLLMERVNVEAQRRKLQRVVGIGATVLAVAAAAVLVIGHTPDAQSADGPQAQNTPGLRTAGDLQAGAVLVKGHALARGDSLALGDTFESTDALFKAPGRVVFSVKSTSQDALPARVKVTATDHPIVLEVARGVVEAQVDKVPSGEAFAIDVVPQVQSADTSAIRIAVHGTHLRVARNGHHVTLDLTEGVVAVGPAPKSGLTVGRNVVAPAHAEFDIEQFETSFTMTSDLSKVRGADSLAVPAPADTTAMQQPVQPAVTVASANTPPSPSAGVVVRPTPPSSEKKIATAPVQPVQTTQAPQPVPSAPEIPLAQREPVSAIQDAIAACVHQQLQPGSNTLVVTSSLNLRIGDDGYVQSARFDPPLEGSVQVCAANTIYKVKFAQGGTQTLPVNVTR